RCLFGLPSVDGIDELGQLSIATLSTIASPLAMLLPYDIPGTPYARGLRFSERLEKRIRALIAERRRDPEGKDALSLLIHAHDEQDPSPAQWREASSGAVLSDDDRLGESNTLFSAGFDTSAHTLTWTLFLLAAHQD